MHTSTSVVTWSVSFFLGWYAHGDQEMALQHSSQPQTNGDYRCCYHDRQRGIKKVRENVVKRNLTCFQFRPNLERNKKRGHCLWAHAHLGQIQELKTLSCRLQCLVLQSVQYCSPAANLKGIPSFWVMLIHGWLDQHQQDLLLGKRFECCGGLIADQLLTLGWIT